MKRDEEERKEKRPCDFQHWSAERLTRRSFSRFVFAGCLSPLLPPPQVGSQPRQMRKRKRRQDFRKTASKRGVLALKRASRQLRAGSFRYSRRSRKLKTSQLKKTPFLPCRSLLAGSLRRCPGHGPLEQTGCSEPTARKNAGPPFKKIPAALRKKDGREKTVFP